MHDHRFDMQDTEGHHAGRSVAWDKLQTCHRRNPEAMGKGGRGAAAEDGARVGHDDKEATEAQEASLLHFCRR